MTVPLASAVLALAALGCSGSGGDDGGSNGRCGPSSGTVDRVIDGDTIELTSGQRIRYLLVDTPESTREVECFGEEAKEANRQLVEGQEVGLTYDVECEDRFERLLAYVEVSGQDVNRRLLERGFACVLQIPPNGEDRVSDYEAVESAARSEGRGLWGACSEVPC